MVKNKSKINKTLSQAADTDNSSGVLNDILNSNLLKEVGMAIAGVVVGELLDKAIDRLMQKNTTHQDVDLEDVGLEADPDQENQSHPNPVRQAVVAATNNAADLKDNAANLKNNVKESVTDAATAIRGKGTNTKDTIHALRATVSELTPDLSDVVAALKQVALQSMQQSGHATSEAANHAVDTVSSTAKSAMSVMSADRSEKKGKKAKKKHKKKNKKSLDARSIVQSR